jgi:hypothetical protein
MMWATSTRRASAFRSPSFSFVTSAAISTGAKRAVIFRSAARSGTVEVSCTKRSPASGTKAVAHASATTAIRI